MKITAARVIVCCPGRNFVTLKIETDAGLHGIGDATLNGRELAVRAYLEDHVVPALIGRDPARIEDTLAIPLPRRVLAARPGDDERDRRRRHGALGHQGQGRADLPLYRTAGREEPRRRDGLRACQRPRHRRDRSTRWRATSSMGYKAIRAQCGVPGLPRPTASPKDRLYLRARGRGARRPRTSGRRREYLDSRAEALRGAARALRLRAPPAARRPPPPDADRGRAAWQGARALSPVLDGGPDARREPGGLSPDPPAHGDADRGRRGLQHDLRLPAR